MFCNQNLLQKWNLQLHCNCSWSILLTFVCGLAHLDLSSEIQRVRTHLLWVEFRSKRNYTWLRNIIGRGCSSTCHRNLRCKHFDNYLCCNCRHCDNFKDWQIQVGAYETASMKYSALKCWVNNFQYLKRSGLKPRLRGDKKIQF